METIFPERCAFMLNRKWSKMKNEITKRINNQPLLDSQYTNDAKVATFIWTHNFWINLNNAVFQQSLTLTCKSLWKKRQSLMKSISSKTTLLDTLINDWIWMDLLLEILLIKSQINFNLKGIKPHNESQESTKVRPTWWS